MYGYTEIVKIWLQHPKVDPIVDDNHPLKWALISVLQADARIDLFHDENECVMLAVFSTQIHVARLLLQDPRINPSRNNNEILRRSLDVCPSLSDTSLIELLLFQHGMKLLYKRR